MIGKNEDKEEIVDRLIITRRKAQNLQLRLSLKGKEEEAKKIKKISNVLTREIDSLLSKLIEDWLGQAETVTNDIRAKNTSLQTSIRDLKENLDNAEKFVKVVGLFDEVLGIAKGLS